MATQKSKSNTVISYRFQRYFPTLQTGHYLCKQAKRQDPVSVFFKQGDIDGACGIYVFVAVMVIFDPAKSIALQDMPNRKYGVPAEVWAVFQHTFFKGVEAEELVMLVNSLNLPLNLTLRESNESGLDRWVVDCLMRGELVAIVTANAKTCKNKHWTLALGVEGLVIGRETKPDTILLLDPSASEPNYRPHNSRLRMTNTGSGSRAGIFANKPIQWLYESSDFDAEPVNLLSAVRFRYVE